MRCKILRVTADKLIGDAVVDTFKNHAGVAAVDMAENTVPDAIMLQQFDKNRFICSVLKRRIMQCGDDIAVTGLSGSFQ